MILLMALVCSGCPGSQQFPSTTPGGGFYVQTFGRDDTTNSVTFTVSGITVHGAFDHDNATCLGTPVGDAYGPNGWTITGASDSSVLKVTNGRVCAYWNLSWESSAPWPGCATTPPVNAYVPLSLPYQYAIGLVCVNKAVIIIDSAPGIIFSPSPTYTDVPSGTVTATGPGFSGAYGMPLFQYFDQNGNLVAQQNATSVASDGNSASGPVPSNISSVPPGFYVGRVSNAASGGSYTFLNTGGVIVGNGGVTIYGGEQSTQVCTQWGVGGDCMQYANVYDYGTVSITINGVTSSVSYGQYDTPLTIASGLANAINANTSINTLVSAIELGQTVVINVTQSGSHYSLSATATTDDPQDFPDGSFFSPYPSAPTL